MSNKKDTSAALNRFAYEIEDCYSIYGTIMMSGCFGNTPDIIHEFIVARPYLAAILEKHQVLVSYGVSVAISQTESAVTFAVTLGGNDDKTAPSGLQLVVEVSPISQQAWELSMADPQARKTMELTAQGPGSPSQAEKVYCTGHYRSDQRLPLTANVDHSLLNRELVNALIVSFNEMARHSGSLSGYCGPTEDQDGKLVFNRYQCTKNGYAKVAVSLVLGKAYNCPVANLIKITE